MRPVSRLIRWLRGPAPQERIETAEVNRLAHIVSQYSQEMDRVRDAIRRDNDEIMKGHR